MKFTMVIMAGFWIFLFALFGCQTSNSNYSASKEESSVVSGSQSGKDKLPDKRIELYYFHTTQRCPTCVRAEAWTEKTLKDHFAAQVASKTIIYQAINFDKDENRKLAERFLIPYNGLVINVVKDSNETYSFVQDLFPKVHEGEQKVIDLLKEIINKEISSL